MQARLRMNRSSEVTQDAWVKLICNSDDKIVEITLNVTDLAHVITGIAGIDVDMEIRDR